MNAVVSLYRGSEKHKNRPATGAKGTLCPEWTHTAPEHRLGNDPFAHDWAKTTAHTLFQQALPHPEGGDRKFATSRGIAFEAKPSNDGCWHGYPIPWESVPEELVERWVDEGAVSNRDVRRHKRYARKDIKWALDSDTQ